MACFSYVDDMNRERYKCEHSRRLLQTLESQLESVDHPAILSTQQIVFMATEFSIKITEASPECIFASTSSFNSTMNLPLSEEK